MSRSAWIPATGVLSRWMKFPAMWRWSLDATAAGSPTNAVDPSKLYDFADTARANAWTTSQTDLRCRPCSAQRVVRRVINSPCMLDVLHGPVAPERIARRVWINPRGRCIPRDDAPPRMRTYVVPGAIRNSRTSNDLSR